MIYQLKYAAFFISYPLIINFIFNCETSVIYITPWAIIASATFMKPAILAPFT